MMQLPAEMAEDDAMAALTYECFPVRAGGGKGLPRVSIKDSTCMDSSICFFTNPQRLMDL
jgi:hypothetical protein